MTPGNFQGLGSDNYGIHGAPPICRPSLLVGALLALGADPNAERSYAQCAAADGSVQLMRLLLDAGARGRRRESPCIAVFPHQRPPPPSSQHRTCVWAAFARHA